MCIISARLGIVAVFQHLTACNLYKVNGVTACIHCGKDQHIKKSFKYCPYCGKEGGIIEDNAPVRKEITDIYHTVNTLSYSGKEEYLSGLNEIIEKQNAFNKELEKCIALQREARRLTSERQAAAESPIDN